MGIISRVRINRYLTSMKISINQLRRIIKEEVQNAMESNEAPDEILKDEMVQVTPEIYSKIYKQHQPNLSVYETYTNPAEGPENHIYTLWGMKGEDIPVISNRTRGTKTVYMAHPKYIHELEG